MAGKTILIGCRLPHGLTLSDPLAKGRFVTLAGMNKSVIVGATYVTTEVDADFWASWKMANEKFPALVSGAIFEASGPREAADKAKELAREKTGFEPMSPTAAGVKPEGK